MCIGTSSFAPRGIVVVWAAVLQLAQPTEVDYYPSLHSELVLYIIYLTFVFLHTHTHTQTTSTSTPLGIHREDLPDVLWEVLYVLVLQSKKVRSMLIPMLILFPNSRYDKQLAILPIEVLGGGGGGHPTKTTFNFYSLNES